MKIKTKSGITEDLDFHRIADELQHRALEKNYYFSKEDIECLVKSVKKEINNFLRDGEILSTYELQYIIRLVLVKSKFRWLCEDLYV